MSEKHKCKICGSASHFLSSFMGSWEPIEIVAHQCVKCGLMFVVNAPSADDRAKGYAEMDRDEWFSSAHECVDASASDTLSQVAKLLPNGRDQLTLLDIGCGDGHLLEKLKERFPQLTLEGTELPGCGDAARKRGFEIHTCELGSIGRQYDVVTIVDVLEHVPDPCGTLSEINQLLKEDGYLLIHTVRQGFTDGLMRGFLKVPGLRKFAKSWFSTRISWDHVQLFSDRSMRIAVEAAGLEVVDILHDSKFGAPVEVYLAKMHCAPAFAPVVKAMVSLYCKMGLLQNKIICVARKPARN